MTDAQPKPSLLAVLVFSFSIFCFVFFSSVLLDYHTIPLTGKAPFFAFNYPDERESQELQAPRISALQCPWLFPSPETLTQVQSVLVSVVVMQTKRRLPGQVQAQRSRGKNCGN